MHTSVVMPWMGEFTTKGTITKWLKKVGDGVKRDEPLFEISTDKVDAEIPSPAAGVLWWIKRKEGETVRVGEVIAIVRTYDEMFHGLSEEKASKLLAAKLVGVTVDIKHLPKSTTKGTITKWLIKVGNRVKVGQPLLEISSDKMEAVLVCSGMGGILIETKLKEGDTVHVGEAIARIQLSKAEVSALKKALKKWGESSRGAMGTSRVTNAEPMGVRELPPSSRGIIVDAGYVPEEDSR